MQFGSVWHKTDQTDALQVLAGSNISCSLLVLACGVRNPVEKWGLVFNSCIVLQPCQYAEMAEHMQRLGQPFWR